MRPMAASPHCRSTHLRAHGVGLRATGVAAYGARGNPDHVQRPSIAMRRALPVLNINSLKGNCMHAKLVYDKPVVARLVFKNDPNVTMLNACKGDQAGTGTGAGNACDGGSGPCSQLGS